MEGKSNLTLKVRNLLVEQCYLKVIYIFALRQWISLHKCGL